VHPDRELFLVPFLTSSVLSIHRFPVTNRPKLSI
jgi:hypothetical protein